MCERHARKFLDHRESRLISLSLHERQISLTRDMRGEARSMDQSSAIGNVQRPAAFAYR